MTRNLLILFIWAAALVNSGATCQRVPIGDHEVCGDKGKLGATCFHFFSEGVTQLDFDAWAKHRFGSLCMNADAFANLKAALLKLCDGGRCTRSEVRSILMLGTRIETFNNEIELYVDSL